MSDSQPLGFIKNTVLTLSDLQKLFGYTIDPGATNTIAKSHACHGKEEYFLTNTQDVNDIYVGTSVILDPSLNLNITVEKQEILFLRVKQPDHGTNAYKAIIICPVHTVENSEIVNKKKSYNLTVDL